MFYKIFILLMLIALSRSGFTQDKEDLQRQKRESIANIKLSRRLLEKTEEKRENSIYQLNLLDKGINSRNLLINNYQREILILEDEIKELDNKIQSNTSVLEKLKEQYAEIIKNTYRNIEDQYVMMYILSSEDLNQGYERIRYIKYLSDYRKNLYAEITERNDSMLTLTSNIKVLKNEKEDIVSSLENEKDELYKDRRRRSRSVKKLRDREKELLEEIKRNEETRRKIEAEIRRIIEEEARRAREDNRMYTLTPEERIISDDFSNNKGGLPWPTVQGIMTGEFGEHPHPVIPGIKIRSNGIDISTVENTEVRAIFKGEVTVVSAILGANYTVIVKHGNFRTVYQNLVDVEVKVGDLVETKEVIGRVGTNVDNETKLHFELWNGMDVDNPEVWLSK